MEIALSHKKTDLALKVMEEAVDHNPDEPLAYYNLISVYDKCKMFEQAEQARQRLKERFAKKVAKDGQSLSTLLRNSTPRRHTMFGSIGFTELILILFIVLIIFGAGKLPQLGRRDRQGDQGI